MLLAQVPSPQIPRGGPERPLTIIIVAVLFLLTVFLFYFLTR